MYIGIMEFLKNFRFLSKIIKSMFGYLIYEIVFVEGGVLVGPPLPLLSPAPGRAASLSGVGGGG